MIIAPIVCPSCGRDSERYQKYLCKNCRAIFCWDCGRHYSTKRCPKCGIENEKNFYHKKCGAKEKMHFVHYDDEVVEYTTKFFPATPVNYKKPPPPPPPTVEENFGNALGQIKADGMKIWTFFQRIFSEILALFKR